jgi:hypothetical protein
MWFELKGAVMEVLRTMSMDPHKYKAVMCLPDFISDQPALTDRVGIRPRVPK